MNNEDLVVESFDCSSNPVGYVDDLSVCSLHKNKMDKILNMVYDYSSKWRFFYNPKKSAIMVHGESRSEAKKGAKYRSFRLGSEKVKERLEYDHVGVKNCLFENS